MNRRIELEGVKLNKCCTFVLPMCEVNYKTFPDNFINCYLKDDQVVVVFDIPKKDDNKFKLFLDYIKLNKNYDMYEEDIDEITLYFNIPDRNKKNYEMFLQGKYSKFSKEFQELLKSYFGTRSRKEDYKVNVIDVISPMDFKKKQVAERLGVDISLIEEVLDKPDLEKETYKPIIKLLEQAKKYDNKQPDSIADHSI